MRRDRQFLRRCYGWLLNLFPREYRDEYGDELQSVFDLALEDAAEKGGLEVGRLVILELISFPAAILYEHLRKPDYAIVSQSSTFEKGGSMGTIKEIKWEELGSWRATLVSLLPLWLFFFAIANLSDSGLDLIALYLVFPMCIFFLWKGWMTFDLLLYSILPMFIQFFFDDIDSSCKLLLKLLCTLILTLGIVGYQRSLNKDSVTFAWLALLLAAIAAWMSVSYAVQNFCG